MISVRENDTRHFIISFDTDLRDKVARIYSRQILTFPSIRNLSNVEGSQLITVTNEPITVQSYMFLNKGVNFN